MPQTDRRRWLKVCECHYEFAAAKVGLRSHSSLHFMLAAKRHSTGTDTHVCSYKCNAMKFYSCLLRSHKIFPLPTKDFSR